MKTKIIRLLLVTLSVLTAYTMGRYKFPTIVGEYYGDYTQYFECYVCLDDIPFILNGEKSLWDFNPNTEEYIF